MCQLSEFDNEQASMTFKVEKERYWRTTLRYLRKTFMGIYSSLAVTLILEWPVPIMSIIISWLLGLPLLGYSIYVFEDGLADKCPYQLYYWLMVTGILHIWASIFPTGRLIVSILRLASMPLEGGQDAKGARLGRKGAAYFDAMSFVAACFTFIWYFTGMVWWIASAQSWEQGFCSDQVWLATLLFELLYMMRAVVIAPVLAILLGIICCLLLTCLLECLFWCIPKFTKNLTSAFFSVICCFWCPGNMAPWSGPPKAVHRKVFDTVDQFILEN